MSRFIRTLDGSMVNLADVIVVRPFDKEADGERWERLCDEHDLRWIKSHDVAVLVLRLEPGEEFTNRAVCFVDEDEVSGLHWEASFVPAEPGWMLQPVDAEGNPHPFLAAEPIIAWAMPLGLPVLPRRGVVTLTSWRLVRPDGTQSVNVWKPDPTNGGRMVEVLWEKPA